MSSNSFTAPPIFHQTTLTKLNQLPFPKQPDSKLLNNCFNENCVNININQNFKTAPLIRPL
jgi:hypothetical protein